MTMVSIRHPHDLSVFVLLYSSQPMHHFQFVARFVVVHASHAIVGVRIAGMVFAQTEQYDGLGFEQLFGIQFCQNNGIVSPFGRNFDAQMALSPVHANEKRCDAQQHISIDAYRLSRCKDYNEENDYEFSLF